MIDLRQYYLDNVKPDEYYYRFFDLVKDIYVVYNVFSGFDELQENVRTSFEVFGDEEAIEKFRMLCQPDNKCENKDDRCWFYLVSFFLDRNGYYIEEFPDVLRRPPDEPLTFIYNQIRDRAVKLHMDNDGTVTYDTRRQIVANLTFSRVSNTVVPGTSIDEQFRRISTRDASFNEMKIDEKISEIANLIENLLKENGNYIKLDYQKVSFEYISGNDIKRYRKQIQCFRHASETSIQERNKFTDLQKQFLIEYGLLICKTIMAVKKDTWGSQIG